MSSVFNETWPHNPDLEDRYDKIPLKKKNTVNALLRNILTLFKLPRFSKKEEELKWINSAKDIALILVENNPNMTLEEIRKQEGL